MLNIEGTIKDTTRKDYWWHDNCELEAIISFPEGSQGFLLLSIYLFSNFLEHGKFSHYLIRVQSLQDSFVHMTASHFAIRRSGISFRNTIWLFAVTPFAGVWIEINECSPINPWRIVTPFAGVWIEIRYWMWGVDRPQSSLPSRECGLKFRGALTNWRTGSVTPFAGVWIEIDQARPSW